jgi:acetate kinase
MDAERNNTRGEEALISAPDSKVQVWVVPTDEEIVIARDTMELVQVK